MKWKTKLHSFISEEKQPGVAVNWFIQVLILVSVISFSVETLPQITPETHHWLYVIETCLVVAFTAEYLIRLFTASKPSKFIFSFFGIIDLLAILPFYVHLSFGFVSLRALRFLRVFRILKLMRYNKAITHFNLALKLAKEELILFVIAAMLLLYFSAVGIYFFENPAQPDKFTSIFSSLWWSVSTLTTVGYGDIYPVTTGGRIFTFAVLLVGLGIISVPAGIISSSMTRAREEINLKKKNEHQGN